MVFQYAKYAKLNINGEEEIAINLQDFAVEIVDLNLAT